MNNKENTNELKKDIIKNYDKYPTSYFADKYNRTLGSIHTLACKLKVTAIHRLNNNKEEIISKYKSGISLKNIKKEFGHDNYTLIDLLKDAGCKIRDKRDSHLKFGIDENYFSKIDSHEKAYWLGFIYADGNIHENKLQIGLAAKDIEILLNFKKHIKSEHKFYKDRDSMKFIVRNNKIISDLNKLGVFPRKSLTLKFPTNKQVPNKYINSFLLGYFDGDGCIFISNSNNGIYHYKRWNFGIVSTKTFIKQFRKILFKVTGKNGFFHKEKRTKENVWYLSFSGGFIKDGGRDIIKSIYKYLYSDINFSLKRKKIIFKDIIC